MIRESDINLLKERIANYEQALALHNAQWQREGLSPEVQSSGDKLEQDAHTITNMAANMVGDLIKDLNDAGVEIKMVDVVTHYTAAPPYHSVFMKAGSIWCSKHITIPGYNYGR